MSIYGNANYLPIDEDHPVQPQTFYAAAKISAETYINLYQTLGINTTIFRMFSVYGPGQSLDNKMQGMVSIFLSYLLENKPIIVKGSKERFRDFVYIDDVVDVWLSSLNNPVSYGKVYNIGSGRKTRVEDLLNVLRGLFEDYNYPIEYRDGTPGDQFGVVANIGQVSQDLNWMPKFDIQKALKKMVDFEKRRLKIG